LEAAGTATATATATSTGVTKYGTSARATAGASAAVVRSTRGKSTALAATAPYACPHPPPGSVRLARANVSVTFVDDARPPRKPVTR
jgi:hypothetical protein